MENRNIASLGYVIIDFLDTNSSWRESGMLTVNCINGRNMFVLTNKNGTRTFPLSQRRAEIYFDSYENPFVVEHNYNMANLENDLFNFLSA